MDAWRYGIYLLVFTFDISLVRYRCEHSKINSISPRVHVLFSIYKFRNCHIVGYQFLFDNLKLESCLRRTPNDFSSKFYDSDLILVFIPRLFSQLIYIKTLQWGISTRSERFNLVNTFYLSLSSWVGGILQSDCFLKQAEFSLDLFSWTN